MKQLSSLNYEDVFAFLKKAEMLVVDTDMEGSSSEKELVLQSLAMKIKNTLCHLEINTSELDSFCDTFLSYPESKTQSEWMVCLENALKGFRRSLEALHDS